MITNNEITEPILTINSNGITIGKPITIEHNLCGKNLFDGIKIEGHPKKYCETIEKQEQERKLKKILPRKWVINGPATILFWQDGTKTIVKCNKDDEFDAQKGYLMAFFEKITGMSKHQIAKLMDEIK